MAEVALTSEALLADVKSAQTALGKAHFWWLGQHSFIVKIAGKVIYIDPFFKVSDRRQTPSLLSDQEGKLADIVLISHGHSDHLCPVAVKALVEGSPSAQFVAPKTEQKQMNDAGCIGDRLKLVSAEDIFEHDGIKVTCLKSKHEFFDEDPILGFPFLGFVIEADGLTFYHAGDTIPYEGLMTRLQKWPHIDIVFLPINGRDAVKFKRGLIGNCTFQEAAEIAGDLKVGLAVPTHYDMFIGNQEDPQKFVDFLNVKYPGVASWVGKAGERVEIGR